MERKELMAKAEELGIEFRKNISTADLEDMVEQANIELELKEKADKIEKSTRHLPKAEPESEKKLSIGARKAKARKEALKLVRVIVASMDQDKSDLQGEIISVGNSLTGFIKKMVPFNREWHIPTFMYDIMKEKKMVATKDRQTPKGVIKENIEVPAYNIVVLPELTQEELDILAKN